MAEVFHPSMDLLDSAVKAWASENLEEDCQTLASQTQRSTRTYCFDNAILSAAKISVRSKVLQYREDVPRT